MSTVAVATEVPIDDAEKARRRFAMESANGTQRAAGFHVDAFLHQLQERYIDGELSIEECIAKLDECHPVKG